MRVVQVYEILKSSCHVGLDHLVLWDKRKSILPYHCIVVETANMTSNKNSRQRLHAYMLGNCFFVVNFLLLVMFAVSTTIQWYGSIDLH